MNQLNSQGIFSNNPIDSNDNPPGEYLPYTSITHIQKALTFFVTLSGNNQQVCAVYNYPAGCIKTDGSTTPFATALY